MHFELEPISPEDAVESYLEEKQSEFAEATLRSQRSRLNHFLQWCHNENLTNLNPLSGRDLHRYRLWRREDGDLAPASEKTQMDTIRVFIRWCESIDAVHTDLSTKVISPSLSIGENSRDVMVTAEAAEKILNYLSTYEYASERHVCFRLMWRAALRRGAVVALDVEDYDANDQSLEVKHRPRTGTPLKNKQRGERFIALSDETCSVLDAWIGHRRPSTTDDTGRDPLLSTPQGRAHPTTIQTYMYSVTKPCLTTGECPHGLEIEQCKPATDRTHASKCPSSVSPHALRRGAITYWLSSDMPEPVVSDRANVSPEILKTHYDRRSKQEKMEQRRGYLDNI
ncbi:tyrosine-type recombinase/integrase [Halobellus inordinatus]|uniref:tyrosine-type recombinase/integrase n=1 Tax=Halobellus inordinatus TaxID=1126236 RepID=UPI00210C465C|nr:site-specific integrase [Halobellus inordinatus]